MTDWSPISGLALLTVVIVLLLAGTGAVVGAVLIGAALCVAIALSADMMGDMKTGYLVGSRPRDQQMVELGVVWIGPIVSLLTILLIASANMAQFGISMGPGTPTVAPQAQALQAVITGVQGGEMPYALYGMGTLMGALLGIGIFPGLGVLVGLSMYLPFIYIATYGVGVLIQMGVARAKGRNWAEAWGVPISQAVAEEFANMTGNPSPVVESTGTGGGMNLFCAGVGLSFPDLTGASRPMKASEYQLCQDNGVTAVTEIPIGFDGIVLGNSVDSEPMDIEKEDLFLALSAQAGYDGQLPQD